MQAYKAGDIVLARFHPAYGHELKKYRPAIVLSSVSTSIDDRFVLVIPLTSHLIKKNEFEIKITNKCLDKPSLCLCWYLTTLDNERVEKKLGHLKPSEVKSINQTVQKLFS